jgi:acetoacetate decarboxylase
VREIISASHILTDLTLSPAVLVHDYLAEPTDQPGGSAP